MKIILPGFPTEIGEEIEMPDMAELLSYPMFYNATPQQFLKDASLFQRKLFSLAPIKYDKKFITIYSSVHIQTPSQYRALTSEGYGHSGWHLDGDLEGDCFDYLNEDPDRVYMIQTACQSSTEFTENPIHIDTGDDKVMDFAELSAWMYNKHDELGIKGKKILPNRFITFNARHYHRAVYPKSMEFRYVMRIRETNYDTSKFNRGATGGVEVSDTKTGGRFRQILQEGNKVTIFFPSN